jgi:sugar phosphate isomerase/epimerase
MKLGFCSNAFTRFPLEEAIDRVAAIGYAGIELLCDRPHFWPPDERPQRAQQLAARLRAAGIAASNINANTAVGAYGIAIPENVFGPSLASGDEATRRYRVAHVCAAIDLAAATGAPCVSITSGAVESDHPPEAGRAQLLRSLDGVLRHAEVCGVRVGIETEPGLLLERSDELARLIAEVGHPLLGFNFDVGHAVVMGEDPARVVAEHNTRIWHLHLEDIAGGKHFHRVPGEGEVDFQAIAQALRQAAFSSFASVEVYAHKSDPDGAARRAFAVLAPLFDRPR